MRSSHIRQMLPLSDWLHGYGFTQANHVQKEVVVAL
jgi:hypothetical protein